MIGVVVVGDDDDDENSRGGVFVREKKADDDDADANPVGGGKGEGSLERCGKSAPAVSRAARRTRAIVLHSRVAERRSVGKGGEVEVVLLGGLDTDTAAAANGNGNESLLLVTAAVNGTPAVTPAIISHNDGDADDGCMGRGGGGGMKDVLDKEGSTPLVL